MFIHFLVACIFIANSWWITFHSGRFCHMMFIKVQSVFFFIYLYEFFLPNLGSKEKEHQG